MDMRFRGQYLESVRREYRQADRRQKSRLLTEARKRTLLNHKVLIRKPAHPAKVRSDGRRRGRSATYGPEVGSVLAKIWELLDCPCGQRLVPAMRTELERLWKSEEVQCSDEIAEKLGRISAQDGRPLAGAGKSRGGICGGIAIRCRTDCCTGRFR